MILSSSGINELIIGKDSYYELELSNIIIIKSQSTSVEKELTLLNISNDRYIKWEYIIVNSSTDEDLNNDKIYLERGDYDITIYNNEEIIYFDNLFVNIQKIEIYDIPDNDDIIYSIPD